MTNESRLSKVRAFGLVPNSVRSRFMLEVNRADRSVLCLRDESGISHAHYSRYGRDADKLWQEIEQGAFELGTGFAIYYKHPSPQPTSELLPERTASLHRQCNVPDDYDDLLRLIVHKTGKHVAASCASQSGTVYITLTDNLDHATRHRNKMRRSGTQWDALATPRDAAHMKKSDNL